MLKNSFRSLSTNNWYDNLPLILLSLRNSYNVSLSTTPANFLFRTPLRLPGELFSPQFHPQSSIRSESPTYDASKVKSFVPKQLLTCQYVWIRQEVKKSSLQRPYCGPYKVLSRTDKYFTIHINGKSQNVTIDRLKPVISFESISNFKKVRFSDIDS